MELEEFTSLLQNPAAITAEQTASLKELLQKYPYFQTARAVRLKGLRNENSLHYNRELKTTAAYSIDRGVLFDFITSEEFDQNLIADSIKKLEKTEKEPVDYKEKATAPDTLSLDQALKKKLREEEEEKLAEPVVSKETEAPKTEEKATEIQKSEELLELGKPLQFHKNENHSFSEWLKLTKAKPIDREAEGTAPPENRSRKFELIDEFISKSPRIKPSQPTRKTNLAEEGMVSPEALMTETLARVYLEQKNYKKAIQAYKILILKNPEKSGFFADQIRAIEKIQEQNS